MIKDDLIETLQARLYDVTVLITDGLRTKGFYWNGIWWRSSLAYTFIDVQNPAFPRWISLANSSVSNLVMYAAIMLKTYINVLTYSSSN